MEKIAIIQKFDSKEGLQEKACSNLAAIGTKIGFNIIGMHKERFEESWLKESRLMILVNIMELYTSQKKILFDYIKAMNPLIVRCVMDLSEQDSIDGWPYFSLLRKSKRNYFCSPKIYKAYLDEDISHACLSFLAGDIDDSWDSMSQFEGNKDQKIKREAYDFWRDIDYILQSERVKNV